MQGWSPKIVPSQTRLPNGMRDVKRELITPSNKVIKLERMVGNGLYMFEVKLTKQQEDNTGICNMPRSKTSPGRKYDVVIKLIGNSCSHHHRTHSLQRKRPKLVSMICDYMTPSSTCMIPFHVIAQ